MKPKVGALTIVAIVVLTVELRSQGQLPSGDEAVSRLRTEAARVKSQADSGLAMDCTDQAIQARRTRRAAFRTRLSNTRATSTPATGTPRLLLIQEKESSSNLLSEYDALMSEIEAMESRCCSRLAEFSMLGQTLLDEVTTLAGFAPAIQSGINDLTVRQGELSKQVEENQALLNSLVQQNTSGIVAAIAEGKWLQPPRLDEAIRRYWQNPKNHIQLGTTELIVTPFGYFKYDKTIQMDSNGTVSLAFHPLEILADDPVLLARRDATLRTLDLQMESDYSNLEEGGVGIQRSIEDKHPDRQAVDFKQPVEWIWSLNKTWRLFANEYPAQFDVTLYSNRPGAAKVEGIRNTIQVSGWFTGTWEFLSRLDTLISLMGSFLSGVGVTLWVRR